MNNLVKSAILALAMPVLVTPAFAASKVAPAGIIIVDMDRVVNESAAGKQAASEIQQKVNQLQTRGQALQSQLRTDAQSIQQGQQNKSLQGAALEQRVKAFQTKQEAARTELGKLENGVQQSREYVMKQITDAATPIVSQIMREQGAGIVLAQDATLQHSASLNVTNEVITRLNAALPRVSTTPPAAPAASGK